MLGNLNDTQPGQPGVDPAQATIEPKEMDSKIDYKGFFETQMNQRLEEKNSLTEKLANDTKLTEQDKFRIEKEIFNIDKELSKFGFSPDVSKDSIVEDIVKAGIQPNTEAYNYIKEAVEGLDYQDAKVVIDGLMGLVKAMGNKGTDPVKLDGKLGNETSKGGDPVGIGVKDILGEEGSASKKALVNLLYGVAQKGL